MILVGQTPAWILLAGFLETTPGPIAFPLLGQRMTDRAETLRRVFALLLLTLVGVDIAWFLRQEPVDAPIVGTTSVEHLEDAVEALEIDLSDSALNHFEEPYEPGEINGHE